MRRYKNNMKITKKRYQTMKKLVKTINKAQRNQKRDQKDDILILARVVDYLMQRDRNLGGEESYDYAKKMYFLERAVHEIISYRTESNN